MTISRATMKQQLKGNRMKKKKVKKMIGGGKLLGSVSPLAGAISGKGIFGRALGKMGRNVSPLGRLLSDQMRKKKKGSVSPAAEAPQGMTATPMAAATPLKGGGRTKNKKPVVKAFAGLSAKLGPIGMATRVIKKSSPDKFANFQKEVASKFGGDPNFKKAMKKIGAPTLAAAPRMMSSGGSLNRKRSVDGIAQRGKTRAR